MSDFWRKRRDKTTHEGRQFLQTRHLNGISDERSSTLKESPELRAIVQRLCDSDPTGRLKMPKVMGVTEDDRVGGTFFSAFRPSKGGMAITQGTMNLPPAQRDAVIIHELKHGANSIGTAFKNVVMSTLLFLRAAPLHVLGAISGKITRSEETVADKQSVELHGKEATATALLRTQAGHEHDAEQEEHSWFVRTMTKLWSSHPTIDQRLEMIGITDDEKTRLIAEIEAEKVTPTTEREPGTTPVSELPESMGQHVNQGALRGVRTDRSDLTPQEVTPAEADASVPESPTTSPEPVMAQTHSGGYGHAI